MDDTAFALGPHIPCLTAPADAGRGQGLCAGTAIEHLSMLIRADNMEEAWATAVASFRALGLAEVIYGYSPDARGAVLGSVDDFLILSTLHRDRISELVARGFHTQSVTFNWAMRHAGVASWSMPVEAAGLPAGFVQRPEALGFFAANGIVSGVSVGFASTRTRGAAALALIAPPEVTQAQVDAWLPGVREALFVIGSVAHRALSGLPWPRPNGDLTERQREVLEWVAEGKTTADIALILGLRPATVEKHLRLARQCLGVETTAHALVKATFLNQVFVRGNPRGGAD